MRKTAEERFWARVDKTDGCWLWTGRLSPKGYGEFSSGGRRDRKRWLSHRFAWELLRGPIPEGYVIDHDNPDYGCHNPACVNPDHLEPVTNAINQQRRRGATATSASGVRGVYWNQESRKWNARATRNGKEYSGGYFSELAEAEQAAIALRARVYGEDA